MKKVTYWKENITNVIARKTIKVTLPSIFMLKTSITKTYLLNLLINRECNGAAQ